MTAPPGRAADVARRRVLPARRSPHDAEIWRLALPRWRAGRRAAVPARRHPIVGQLGTRPLAGLAIAGTCSPRRTGICNFLAYSTTAAVARRRSGDWRGAAEQGIDGIWLAAGLGVALAVVGIVLAPCDRGGDGRVGRGAAVRAHVLPHQSDRRAGNARDARRGRLPAGLQDTRTTLVIAVAANVANLVIEVLFVYGSTRGRGVGVGNRGRPGRCGNGTFAWRDRRRAAHASARPHRAGRRPDRGAGGPLAVRTVRCWPCSSAATAMASRLGDAESLRIDRVPGVLPARLSLDGIAIAGQAITGRTSAPTTRAGTAAARRMVEWGVVVGVVLGVALAVSGRGWCRSSPTTPGSRTSAEVLWIVALLQPFNAVVFVLDGVLIGAGDARYLALAMAVATVGVYAPRAPGARPRRRRCSGCGPRSPGSSHARSAAARYLGTRWLVTGATRPLSRSPGGATTARDEEGLPLQTGRSAQRAPPGSPPGEPQTVSPVDPSSRRPDGRRDTTPTLTSPRRGTRRRAADRADARARR